MTPNPCFRDGVDCPNRCLGCRQGCDAWREWEAIHATEMEQRRRRKEAERDADNFLKMKPARDAKYKRNLRAKERRK